LPFSTHPPPIPTRWLAYTLCTNARNQLTLSAATQKPAAPGVNRVTLSFFLTPAPSFTFFFSPKVPFYSDHNIIYVYAHNIIICITADARRVVKRQPLRRGRIIIIIISLFVSTSRTFYDIVRYNNITVVQDSYNMYILYYT